MKKERGIKKRGVVRTKSSVRGNNLARKNVGTKRSSTSSKTKRVPPMRVSRLKKSVKKVGKKRIGVKKVTKPIGLGNDKKGNLVAPRLSMSKKDVFQRKKLEEAANKIREEIHGKSKGKIDKKPKKQKAPYFLTGISGFDALFDSGQGIPSGASILVEGGPGSGKTIFCLNTLYNLCKKGKKGLFMSFEEPEHRLIEHMEKFGWKVKPFIDKDLLRVKRFDALDVSRSVEALLSAAKKELLIEIDPVLFPEDFDPDFIVIDSLTSIASAFSGQESRFRVYMEQLFRYLEKNNITNFLIREVSSPTHIGTTFAEQGQAVSFLSDGIIVIYNVISDDGSRSSATEILKMRGSSFQKKIVQMKIINGKGLEVYPHKVLKKNRNSGFELT